MAVDDAVGGGVVRGRVQVSPGGVALPSAVVELVPAGLLLLQGLLAGFLAASGGSS